MKEEKFTLGAEKQMVQKIGWSGGLTATPPPGLGGGVRRCSSETLTNFQPALRRILPPMKNQEKKFLLRFLLSNAGDFLEI